VEHAEELIKKTLRLPPFTPSIYKPQFSEVLPFLPTEIFNTSFSIPRRDKSQVNEFRQKQQANTLAVRSIRLL